jgi:hypothetical protein
MSSSETLSLFSTCCGQLDHKIDVLFRKKKREKKVEQIHPIAPPSVIMTTFLCDVLSFLLWQNVDNLHC